jgi:flagellar motor switch protein FliM
VVFFAATLVIAITLFAPPTQNLPKGPITINARPTYSDSINKTNVIFWIPENNITVEVTFKVKNDNNSLFIYLMLPFSVIFSVSITQRRRS